jgi:hypothetical protein
MVWRWRFLRFQVKARRQQSYQHWINISLEQPSYLLRFVFIGLIKSPHIRKVSPITPVTVVLLDTSMVIPFADACAGKGDEIRSHQDGGQRHIGRDFTGNPDLVTGSSEPLQNFFQQIKSNCISLRLYASAVTL